ncbi:hypothetical protein KSC_039680 [Ktedonobacter sp. SOSP1-52]|uniref:Eco57I restriction-modification methylase domain-containing protein n=1 Tax=Ktedonobacter sp. SOSP1-52 TaxID=2778366 RepID=UPI001915DB48|nr:DNA methyltransferase [Ktedonobacter sp. SOSP1-52]GHO65076.1 hypothetical protein KSC_039680 [Ktedonobacter sp. SOSP1-52]
MSNDKSTARQHANWLALIDISGPFVSMPVLLKYFPQGLDLQGDEAELRRRVRLAYEEWADNQGGTRPDPAIHTQWLRFVLEEVLSMDEQAILEGQAISADLSYTSKEYGETIRPDMVIRSPFEPKPRVLVQLYPPSQDLEKAVTFTNWKVSPATRMMEMLREKGVRLGLVTNGRFWMLVDAPEQETTGYYTWDATLWTEEPLTLRAFHSLLGTERFFNVPEDQTIETLLTESAQKQQEVTDQLGEQVRRAVEMLVHTLDRIDKDQGRQLLTGVTEKELYEAALTVMMRLVFLLSAEERNLLCLGEALYDQNYAVSTMIKQLREQADQQTEEVLGLRHDAWCRLLALFRIVYGGVEHPDLSLPAYGGRLFDPDRFPFLEGRARQTNWRETPANPLRIDNRTVLYLLNALQYLQVRIPGGGTEPRRLSFRGLDIEQIGHVYEGLLDHTARRAPHPILGLQGASDLEPEVSLDELEAQARKGEAALLEWLQENTKRSKVALQKSLAVTLEKQEARSRLMEACDNKQELFERVLPFVGLLRKDSFDSYVIVTPGSVYVTKGSDRRSTGTHYTPRSLTEPIVKHTLDPLVYVGPAEGLPEEQWRLRGAAEILDLKICDFAMGSGAFLVQACRYLADKLVLAWEHTEQQQQATDASVQPILTGPEGRASRGIPSEELLPLDPEERLAYARRLIAERCIYGVDKNPMAVEMAKLSLWLITLARHKPFTFLDHNLRSGDTLLGATERQIFNWSLAAQSGDTSQGMFVRAGIDVAIENARRLRQQIRSLQSNAIDQIEEKARKLKEADEALDVVKLGADMLVGITLQDTKRRQSIEQGDLGLHYFALVQGFAEAQQQRFTAQGWQPILAEYKRLRAEANALLNKRTPFHWDLQFPEVFAGSEQDRGFSAIVSNPPFQGGKKITGALGIEYRNYLVEYLGNKKTGVADLCAYFFLRATNLLKQEGMASLIATNTIAQGDTREVGLDQIVAEGWSIPRAISSRKWPGEANLEIAQVWLRKGKWHNTYMLNDVPVIGITPFLAIPGRALGNPYRLISNAKKSFQGSVVLGTGFILAPEEAQALINEDPRAQEVLFPFLNGEDLNSRPDQSPSRWVINFYDWPLEKAETYQNCLRIIRERVKPERDKLGHKADASARGYAKFWWQYARKGIDLYSTIANMKRVLVVPRVSKYCLCNWEPLGIVYSDATAVIAAESDAYFTLIQCTFHSDWTRVNGSSMRNDQRYTPSDCFETFPFPPSMESLKDIGELYYNHRQAIMQERQEG